MSSVGLVDIFRRLCALPKIHPSLLRPLRRGHSTTDRGLDLLRIARDEMYCQYRVTINDSFVFKTLYINC
jgi:hypothetical protein